MVRWTSDLSLALKPLMMQTDADFSIRVTRVSRDCERFNITPLVGLQWTPLSLCPGKQSVWQVHVNSEPPNTEHTLSERAHYPDLPWTQSSLPSYTILLERELNFSALFFPPASHSLTPSTDVVYVIICKSQHKWASPAQEANSYTL